MGWIFDHGRRTRGVIIITGLALLVVGAIFYRHWTNSPAYLLAQAQEALNRGAETRADQLLKPFRLGRYEVTQKQWQTVMGNNPALFKVDVNRGDGGFQQNYKGHAPVGSFFRWPDLPGHLREIGNLRR